MTVLIAGGTGFVGRAIAEALEARNDEVLIATRTPTQRNHVDYKSLPEQVDAVVNLAGEPILGRWTPAKKQRILQSRIQTTRLLVDWMLDMPGHMPTFVSTSGCGFYGHRPGETLTECSPADPNHRFRSQVCVAWEAEANRAAAFGVRTCVLRLGTVLSRNGGAVQAALQILRKTPIAIPPSAQAIMPWVSLDDVVRLYIWLIDHPQASDVFNVSAPNPITLGRFTRSLTRLCGKPCFGSLSAGMVRLALGELSEAIVESQDMRPAHALELGFGFRHPLFEDWLRDEFDVTGKTAVL